MKFQISTDHAVRILQHLYKHRGDGLQTAMDIVNATGISYPFCIKITNQLKAAGLVKSEQGRRGGYRLGRQGHGISFYDVVLAVEGEVHLHECLKDGNRCTYGEHNNCRTHEYLATLQGKVIKELSSQSIVDLMS